MPQAICYISNASILLDKSELDKLFTQSISSNIKNNITGLLTYKDGTFLQLLEGNQKQVNDLFKTICKDSRHNQITKIMDCYIEFNIFEDYKTGFSSSFRHGEMEELNFFIANNANSPYGRNFKALLKPFVLIHA